MKHRTLNKHRRMCGNVCETGPIKRESKKKLNEYIVYYYLSNSMCQQTLWLFCFWTFMLTVDYVLCSLSYFLFLALLNVSPFVTVFCSVQIILLFSQFEMSLKPKSFSIKYLSKVFFLLFGSKNSIHLCSANKWKCLTSIHWLYRNWLRNLLDFDVENWENEFLTKFDATKNWH